MTKLDAGSGASKRGSGPTVTVVRPSSSRSSLSTASVSDSPAWTLPPGNSQRPPCRLCAGRWQTRYRSPRRITAATTGVVRGLGAFMVGQRIAARTDGGPVIFAR